MKFIRILVFSLFLMPLASFGASSDFMLAAQLLAAAKSADIQQVQSLVNNGADVNFVDSTGLSIVCTALMNNDVRAAQILQMYGADASNCDRQIKKYNNKNKPKGGGGLFSGLSSAQGIGLAAAGAAVVVGGLLLLTDVFDPGNDNDSSSSGGDRPSNNPNDNPGGGSVTAAFTLPYGPAMPDADAESANYVKNLNLFSPDDDSIFAHNFAWMTDGYKQNYMLMMHGYSPLARGYLGMQTLRSSASKGPLNLSGVNWFSTQVLGGRPVNVALVTSNGINSNGYAYDVDAKSSLTDTLLPWTTTNGTTVSNADNSMVSSKYYNNLITFGSGDATRSGATTAEDGAALQHFDLAGYGTVVNNAYASADVDDLLAKVVGGRTSGYANADFIGFMPNGQMTIYRTGNGMAFADTENVGSGSYLETDGKLSEIVLFGKNLTVTLGDGNSFTASYTETTTDENGEEIENTTTYSGYIGTNGYLYIDSAADGDINQAYKMDGGALTLEQELQQSDYFNFKALRHGANLWAAGDLTNGRSKPDIVANASIIEPLHASGTETIEDILSWANNTQQQAGLSVLVNKYYDVVDDSYWPGADATYIFGNLGSNFSPLMIFSTGAFETDNVWSGKTLSATFENSVPLVYENAEHLFMSVVGVGLTGDGTMGTTSVSGYAPSGKIALTQWSLDNGTPDNASDDKYYKARMCGIAGTGMGNIDPWCFAAAGVTDELAVSSAAGAAGAIKSAFSYLTNKQIFALMALTADGPLLGTQTNGSAFTEDTLVSYLQGMYQLPNEYQAQVDSGADYLDIFAQVFGYGLINLERATKPGTSVYYYNGDNIVSADGNAYWRAATNTMFRPSAVLNLRGASIQAPFFDILTNVDGSLSLPRVWQNEFAMGATDKRGLYMGDVLGDLKTRRENTQRNQIGAVGLTMSFSERAYNDNLNGLDNLSLDYTNGNWNFGASYQHYLTDGASRFSGMANPVLGLMSNAVVSDATYKSGKWSFGARAFSGAITDEGLLENDPTISAQYMPAKLGLMQGGAAHMAWSGDKFALTGSIGNAHETNTVLGAQTGGLLNMGNGNTVYVDTMARYKLTDNIDFMARATLARTTSNAGGEFILGMTDIESNAFAFGANVGKFEFSVAQPLAIVDGALRYAYADYAVTDNGDNTYELNVVDTHIENLALAPYHREVRFTGTYRHQFGEFTDGAFGFIYRVNPNHTDEFGNESVFMFKLSHRLGI